MMRSSYIQNNYGEIFEAIIAAWRPRICVELGVLDGYSSLAMGRGIRAISQPPFNTPAHLDSYDLFEDYAYNHGSQKEVQKAIDDAGLTEYITLFHMDAYQVHEKYQADSVALLHVDISNSGETVRRIMDLWDPKMVQGGIILIEGGTEEADQIEWRVKYHAPSIKKEIETNKLIEQKYIYASYYPWPGLTFLLKKR